VLSGRWSLLVRGAVEEAVSYEDFLASKSIVSSPAALIEVPQLNSALFPFQRDCAGLSLKRQRSCVFGGCGTGKTFVQTEVARHIPGDVLILAPLAVANQTVQEAAKFGITVRYCRSESETQPGITVTNYEMVGAFDTSRYTGVVLDESSILKAHDGKTRNSLIEAFRHTPYKLCCSATPAPNDFTEIGNHAEFLGVMSRVEMLSMFFVHDGGETQKWRLKGHAEQDFWRWVASWAVMFRTPSDLGYDDAGFILPPLQMHEHYLRTDKIPAGELFAKQAATLGERIGARRDSIHERVARAAALVNSNSESWVVWCHLNDESDALVRAIPDAIEIRGSDSLDVKVEKLEAFTNGKARVLVTKAKMTAYGVNWQHCARQCFVGIDDSWEQFYQAIRRSWRFGQKRPVDIHLIVTDTQGAVLQNLKDKEARAEEMAAGVISHMRAEMQRNLGMQTERTIDTYQTDCATGDTWTMHLGDCVEVTKSLPSNSVHYSVFSPPFSSLYTYSASDRDMGNCKNTDEFMAHFKFLVAELYRVMMPGRLLSFHCMNLPTSKTHHGYIGIQDFRGDLISLFRSAGFIYHSEVCIWKDPVTAMQRTKALGLLYKQLKKDSAMSRQGIPDYLVTMRKPGENPETVTKDPDDFPVGLWQRYASPVWFDINPSDTLQHRSAREDADERHIAPLQLQVIQRAVDLWSNPGDTVLSPFGGIGSEGYVSLRNGRRFLGIELKRSYWQQAVANLKAAHADNNDLFAEAQA
jgi:DNA modification methylase